MRRRKCDLGVAAVPWALFPSHLPERVMRQSLVEARGRGPIPVGAVLTRVSRGLELRLHPGLAQAAHERRPADGLQRFFFAEKRTQQKGKTDII